MDLSCFYSFAVQQESFKLYFIPHKRPPAPEQYFDNAAQFKVLT